MSICVKIPALPEPLKIRMPGGASITDIDPLSKIQPALAPLAPFFTVIEAVNSLKAVVDAMLGLPSDTKDLFAAIPGASAKIGEVAELMPQVAIPAMVKDIIEAIIAKLQQVKGNIKHLIKRLEAPVRAMEMAQKLNDARLFDHAACAEKQCKDAAKNIFKSLAVVGALLTVLTKFLELIGESAPSFDLNNLDGLELEQVEAPLDELITTLQTLAGNIPG